MNKERLKMKISRSLKRALVVSVSLALSVTALTGCGADKSSDKELPSTDSDAKVKLEFWGWAPGYEDAVKLWNTKHPETQVTFTQTPSTNEIYPKMFTAIKANNAPCLAQIEYSSLPNFVIQQGVEDIAALTKGMDKDFTEDGWKSVSIADGVYGIPVDTAPIAFIYRKDLFDKYGLTVPKTWEEYKEMAKKVKNQDPSVSIGYYSNDANWFAALARQKGAKWFDLKDDSWSVSIDDKATMEVAEFWQSMIDEGLVSAQESYTPALYKQMADDKILSEPFGIWDTAVIAQSVQGSSGKWAVAPMPVWKDRPDTYVSAGGSATTVLKGCKNADRAIEFAHWMSTDPEAVKLLITKGGLWPASLEGLQSPVLDEGVEFYGGQKIYEPFKEISRSIKLDWTWGPLQNQVNKDIVDFMPKVSKEKSIADTVTEIQNRAVKDIKDKGLTVSN
ncbi:MAG: extracellular solute-binding protein [Actinomycetaceae bacterium]|nr:extracellular solute-binding protein [Actinomycetaceae bacterium]